MANEENGKLSQAEFVLMAVDKLTKQYKRKDGTTSTPEGIHSVYSGFNNGFRGYFNEDPITWTTKLEKEGVIATRRAKGGIMIYRPDNLPKNDALVKMGLL